MEAMKTVDDWVTKEMMMNSIDLKVLGGGNSCVRRSLLEMKKAITPAVRPVN